MVIKSSLISAKDMSQRDKNLALVRIKIIVYNSCFTLNAREINYLKGFIRVN
jgi:hypothetical protein